MMSYLVNQWHIHLIWKAIEILAGSILWASKSMVYHITVGYCLPKTGGNQLLYIDISILHAFESLTWFSKISWSFVMFCLVPIIWRSSIYFNYYRLFDGFFFFHFCFSLFCCSLAKTYFIDITHRSRRVKEREMELFIVVEYICINSIKID